MTLTSSVPDVIDYLLAQCLASASLGAATPPVEIIDGPQVTDDSLTEGQRLWVGHDAVNGGATQSSQAGTAPQRFAFLDQARTRDEYNGQVVMTAQDWSGDSAIKTHRDACKTLVGAVETMLRGSPPLGPGDASMGGLVQWSEVVSLEWYQEQNQSGAWAACVFKISYYRRLTP